MENKVFYNVLMKDGNRSVNWDFNSNSTVFQCLEKFKWTWKPNTVKVSGMSVKNDQLGRTLAYMMAQTNPDAVFQNNTRLTITMVPLPEKKRPRIDRQEVRQNVH